MYIKITVNTGTEIAYASCNHRSLNATVRLYARYSTVWLATMIILESTFVYSYRPVVLTPGINSQTVMKYSSKLEHGETAEPSRIEPKRNEIPWNVVNYKAHHDAVAVGSR